MKKRMYVLLAVTVTAGMLAGCGTAAKRGGAADGAGDSIQIAVAGPMTGDNSEYGIGFYNAARLKAEEWNAQGGVLGKKIEIVQYDDKNTSEEATTIAQKLVSDKKVVGVIGHFSSGVCMTAAPLYNEHEIIEISPSASHPDYSSIGKYIFRNNTVISKEGAASVDIAVNTLGKKRIGIISIMTDWGTNTSKIIKELVEKTDAEVVAHEEVTEGSDDYTPAIIKLNELSYKGVTGNIKFDENGDVDKEFVKVTIKDGKFTKME